jgi:hypothetical protein
MSMGPKTHVGDVESGQSNIVCDMLSVGRGGLTAQRTVVAGHAEVRLEAIETGVADVHTIDEAPGSM